MYLWFSFFFIIDLRVMLFFIFIFYFRVNELGECFKKEIDFFFNIWNIMVRKFYWLVFYNI